MKKFRLLYFSIMIGNVAWAGPSPSIRMGLITPTTGQFDYPTIIANDLQVLDSSTALQGQPNTFTSSNTFSGATSTVTVRQDLNLPYVGSLQCLAVNASGDVIGQSCASAGTPNLAVFNGGATNTGVAISSPTGGINMSSAAFVVTLQGPSTAFVTPNFSSMTAQGNTFNGASQLTQTDAFGHLPSSVFSSAVIISTSILQSGTTFFTSSGTANSLNASTATVYTLLQVPGTGQTGTTVVGQIVGSAFTVLANGQVGLGTAAPGASYGLDEQQGTANFKYGINTSTITFSSATINAGGRLTFGDGTVQVTAAISGATNLAISSGSAATSTIVSSPTVNVVFDSTTFSTTLTGSASSFVHVQFPNITGAELAVDGSGNVISTTTVNNGIGTDVAYYAISGKTVSGSGALQITNANTIFISPADSLNISATGSQILFGQNPSVLLDVHPPASGSHTITVLDPGGNSNVVLNIATQTFTGQNNWTTPAQSTFTYGLTVGSITAIGASSFSTATVSNVIYIATSTPTNPVIQNIADQDTGIYFPGADMVGITVVGVPAIMATSTGTSLAGVTDGSAAQAGVYGEYLSTASAAAVNTPATATWGDLVSVSISSGDWRMTGQIEFNTNGGNVGEFDIGISTTAGNSSAGLIIGQTRGTFAQTSPGGTTSQAFVHLSTRVLNNATMTYYLKYMAINTNGQPLATGILVAERRR